MWFIIAWQHISPEVNVKGLRCAVYPMQMMGLMVICCETALKRMGKLGVSVRKMKALNVKIKTVTLTGKGRQTLTRFMY